MPTDPKWRTIARVSGESIALVQATYLHLLVTASRNVTRGHVDVTTEDLASALDVTEQQIEAVLNAMEGRVLENGYLSGWDKRQPKKEDSGDDESGAKSAAERKRAQREREKLERENTPDEGVVTDCHDKSRNVTLDKDKDKDKELNTDPQIQKKNKPAASSSTAVTINSWLKKIKLSGEQAIPVDDPIFEYCQDAGIPSDWLRICWIEFRQTFSESDKRQKDWRAHFRNFVRKNYFSLWWHNGTEYQLSSKGYQAMTAMNNRDRREEAA